MSYLVILHVALLYSIRSYRIEWYTAMQYNIIILYYCIFCNRTLYSYVMLSYIMILFQCIVSYYFHLRCSIALDQTPSYHSILVYLIIWQYNALCYTTSSYHFLSYRAVLYSFRFIVLDHIIIYCMESCHLVLLWIVFCCVVSYSIIWHYMILYDT